MEVIQGTPSSSRSRNVFTTSSTAPATAAPWATPSARSTRRLRAHGELLAERVGPGDVVVLHDPQTAGLVPPMKAARRPVVWRSHIGLDLRDDSRGAHGTSCFHVERGGRYVFSPPGVPCEGLDRGPRHPPSIDPFSPKNQPLTPGVRRSCTPRASSATQRPTHRFARRDGSPATSTARRIPEAPPCGRPRWCAGLALGPAEGHDRACSGLRRARRTDTEPHLVSPGPTSRRSATTRRARRCSARSAAWRPLPARRGAAPLGSADARPEENAAIVNALQRHADVVVQKSLAEGFGLTVAEAMWKGRPVVATAVGGIPDQIEDGERGLLLDPRDLGDVRRGRPGAAGRLQRRGADRRGGADARARPLPRPCAA